MSNLTSLLNKLVDNKIAYRIESNGNGEIMCQLGTKNYWVGTPEIKDNLDDIHSSMLEQVSIFFPGVNV
jgi:hypothetical protein